jgi:hypothetical protein
MLVTSLPPTCFLARSWSGEPLWRQEELGEDIYNGTDFVVAMKYHAFGKTFL